MSTQALEFTKKTTSANYKYRTTLLGTTYIFKFTWNERDAAWFFGVFTPEDEPIFQGRRLTLNAPHLLGQGIVVATAPDNSQPGRDDIGKRVSMLFLYEDDA